MFRIPVVLIALTIMTSTSTALAIDCLSYLAADTVLEKANNDAYAAYRKTVQAAEATWQDAVQNREVAWKAAGKAASAVLAEADAVYQDAFESADRDLRKAKADADANRKLAEADAWTALEKTVSEPLSEIVDPAQVAAYRNAWSTYRQATETVFVTPEGVPKYLAITKDFFETKFALEDALANVPAAARARHNEIRLAAEVKHRQTMVSIVEAQRERYSVATDRHQQVLDRIREISNEVSNSTIVHLNAGKAAYTAYWQTIHDAYFAYKNIVNPAESDLSEAKARAKDEWKLAYINIYQNPNIGLQRNVSGETTEKLFASAEAERRLCPY